MKIDTDDIVRFKPHHRINGHIWIVHHVNEDGTLGTEGTASWPVEDVELVGKSVAAFDELAAIVSKLPRTLDGTPVVVGSVLVCPKGHETEILPSSGISGRIYCTDGECWSDGCQGDSGSGTNYSADKCTGKK